MSKPEQRGMIDFLCGLCNEYTRAPKAPLALGENTCAITCVHCGERWYVTYEVLSCNPLSVGDWEIKRTLGMVRGGTFYAKEDMQ